MIKRSSLLPTITDLLRQKTRTQLSFSLKRYCSGAVALLFVFLLTTATAHAAIAVDATQAGSLVNGTSQTTSVTVGSGSNRMLIGVVFSRAATPTGVTYNGAAMTQVGTSQSSGAGPDYVTVWCLVAPTSGANNAVVSRAAGNFINSAWASYTGVAQTCTPDATTSFNQALTSYSPNVTTTADNAWLITGARGGSGSLTAGASTLLRIGSTGGGDVQILDSNGPRTPAGSQSLTLDDASGPIWGAMGAFAPAADPVVPSFGDFVTFE